MSKTANNVEQICTHEEFERFRSFHELFTQLMKDHNLPNEQFDQLSDDIDDFDTVMVPIAQKVEVDLSKHIDIVVDIWEQLGSWPDPYDTPSLLGDEYGEAISNYAGEQEIRLEAWKEAIADINRVMVKLYASRPKDTEVIEPNPGLMIEVLEDVLERLKLEHAGKRNKRLIIGWIFKKTSHLICVIIIAVIASVIAAIVVDIFADFGWIGRIKDFIYRIVVPK